jgi:hypothetical protein
LQIKAENLNITDFPFENNLIKVVAINGGMKYIFFWFYYDVYMDFFGEYIKNFMSVSVRWSGALLVGQGRLYENNFFRFTVYNVWNYARL